MVEQLEHALSQTLEDRIDEALGFPTIDPHGDPIPGKDGTVDNWRGQALAELAPGSTAIVNRVPDYEPPLLPLFGEKEGKIAKANRGKDPLYLFAALQRQLGYPEVPRPQRPDDAGTRMLTLQAKLHELETRLKLVESELRGQVDLSQFSKPEFLPRPAGEER